MATDRFIRFANLPAEPITPRAVADLCQGYLGDTAVVEPSELMVVALLRAPTSSPFRHLPEYATVARAQGGRPERLFEVYIEPTCLDVITRGADPFTSAVADGFADVLATFYGGVRED